MQHKLDSISMGIPPQVKTHYFKVIQPQSRPKGLNLRGNSLGHFDPLIPKAIRPPYAIIPCMSIMEPINY